MAAIALHKPRVRSHELLHASTNSVESKASAAALALRQHWLTVEWLPKYAPELNDIEVVWGHLKARHLAHQTFADHAGLDGAIH